MVFKDNVLDTIVFTLHFQRFSVATAHARLTEIVERNPYTMDDVAAIYEKINGGLFSLEKSEPNFATLPDLFNKEVVKKLDISTRAILRKTCKIYRELVDNHPFHIKHLFINLYAYDEKHISISYDKVLVKYESNGDKCTITRDRNERVITGDYQKVAFDDLMSILKNPKLKIGTFHVSKRLYWNCVRPSEPLLSSLGSSGLMFNVKRFEWELNSKCHDVTKVLKICSPDVLESVRIRKHCSENCFHPDEELFTLLQWKNERKLYHNVWSFSPENWLPLAHFTNASLFCRRYEDLTWGRILALKDKLLENPLLKQIKIEQVDSGWGFDFLAPGDNILQSFDYPDSDHKLSLEVTRMSILFKGPAYVEGEGIDDDEDSDDSDEESDESSSDAE